MACQRVVLGQRHHEGLAVHDDRLDALGVATARPQQTGIDLALLQRLQLARRLHGQHLHVHLLMAGAELREHARQHTRGHGRGDIAQLDMAAHALGRQLPDLLGPLHMAQHGHGLFIEQLARIGQRDGFALVALQQAHAQLLFQLLHLHADGGLGHAQLVGGTREVQLLGHGDEVLELAVAEHGFNLKFLSKNAFNPVDRIKQEASNQPIPD